MKILHTSDWHLGRSLYAKKRYEEFDAFLNWLLETIKKEQVDALLVAGDIFDTTTPSNRAQELYYRFLCKIAGTGCSHVVIIAGNHDSPSFLAAPKEILKILNVHVVSSACENIEDEIITILDSGSHNSDCEALQINPEKSVIICAVPYLRDKDIRIAESGDSIDDKNRKLIEGIKSHYEKVVTIAKCKREEITAKSQIKNQKSKIPIISMGHFFASGGQTLEGDGVRELYVGSLLHVGVDQLPDQIDYFALGHLHVPQCVQKKENFRYSGSPIPMGFGEAKQKKQVIVVDFSFEKPPEIKTVPVPCFQRLEKIVGDMGLIQGAIEELKKSQDSIWIEIEYTGDNFSQNLREEIESFCENSNLEILRIKNRQMVHAILQKSFESESLDDLDVYEVFSRRLDLCAYSQEEKSELTISYKEIVHSLEDFE